MRGLRNFWGGWGWGWGLNYCYYFLFLFISKENWIGLEIGGNVFRYCNIYLVFIYM